MSHKLQYTQPVPEHTDSWHQHTADEGQPQEEHAGHTNAPVLAGAFIGSFLFVAIVIGVTYLYFEVQTTRLRETRIETTVMGGAAREYKSNSLKELQEFSFANTQAAKAGVVSIPLEQAEQQVLARYTSNGAPNTSGGGK